MIEKGQKDKQRSTNHYTENFRSSNTNQTKDILKIFLQGLNIYTLSENYTIALSNALARPDHILPAVMEITVIKQHIIIVSNWKCSK
jgi:hypothetical protein